MFLSEPFDVHMRQLQFLPTRADCARFFLFSPVYLIVYPWPLTQFIIFFSIQVLHICSFSWFFASRAIQHACIGTLGHRVGKNYGISPSFILDVPSCINKCNSPSHNCFLGGLQSFVPCPISCERMLHWLFWSYILNDCH